jgi:hypothetical protein
MHLRYKALRFNFRAVLQMDTPAAGSFFQSGFNPGDEIPKVQLYLCLNRLR